MSRWPSSASGDTVCPSSGWPGGQMPMYGSLLLVGEGMSRAELIDARAIIESDPVIEKAGGVLTMYFGPSNMLMAVDATFRKDAAGDEVMAAIDRVERALKARFPQAARIYIESENLSSVERQRQIQRAMPEE